MEKEYETIPEVIRQMVRDSSVNEELMEALVRESLMSLAKNLWRHEYYQSCGPRPVEYRRLGKRRKQLHDALDELFGGDVITWHPAKMHQFINLLMASRREEGVVQRELVIAYGYDPIDKRGQKKAANCVRAANIAISRFCVKNGLTPSKDGTVLLNAQGNNVSRTYSFVNEGDREMVWRYVNNHTAITRL